MNVLALVAGISNHGSDLSVVLLLVVLDIFRSLGEALMNGEEVLCLQ